MIDIEYKYRDMNSYDVIITIPPEIYSEQLKCDIMNVCPGQFTIYNKYSFSFCASYLFDREKWLKRMEDLQKKKK